MGVSRRFYDSVLEALGYSRSLTADGICAWTGAGTEILVYVCPPDQRAPEHRLGNPGWHHAAFATNRRDIVDRVHEVVAAGGYRVLNTPREYPQYSEGYYAVYFEDPDNLKLEVAFIPGHS